MLFKHEESVEFRTLWIDQQLLPPRKQVEPSWLSGSAEDSRQLSEHGPASRGISQLGDWGRVSAGAFSVLYLRLALLQLPLGHISSNLDICVDLGRFTPVQIVESKNCIVYIS
jgi:hypothetical protein